jgi:hypothetical protein
MLGFNLDRPLSPGIFSGHATPNIVFVGGFHTSSNNQASPTVSLDGTLTGGIADTPAAGDILIGIVAGGSTLSDDRNYTLSGDESGALTEICDIWADDVRESNLAVYTAVMGATPDTLLTASGVKSTGTYGTVTAGLVFRNVSASPILDVDIETATGTDSHRANPPTATPANAGAWVIPIGIAVFDEPKSAQPSFSGYDTLYYARAAGSDTDAKLLVGKLAWVSGEADPPAWTDADSDDTNSSWAAATVVLRRA